MRCPTIRGEMYMLKHTIWYMEVMLIKYTTAEGLFQESLLSGLLQYHYITDKNPDHCFFVSPTHVCLRKKTWSDKFCNNVNFICIATYSGSHPEKGR